MSRVLPLAILAVLAAAVAVDAAATLHNAHKRVPAAPGGSSASLATGIALDKPLPNLGLVDEHGRTTSLAAFRGRYVVLAPFLTLCHEVCPLTTAALERVAAAVRARNLEGRVVVAEASVDPWRDSPARLRAFKRRTGTRLELLTGSRRQLGRLWRALGVQTERTRGDGEDRDWWTGGRLRFDVSHTDGVFLIDPRGHVRIFAGGMPGVGRLPARLRALLNAEGRHNLRRPESPWSVPELLDDLWRLMGVAPATPSTRSATPGERSDSPLLRGVRAQGGLLLGGGAPALQHRLTAMRGHPAVVNAWASWCAPCRSEFPLFARAAERFGRDVAFLGLDVSDRDARARAFLADHRVPYPSYADDDGAAARALSGLQGLPTTVFLDRSGKVTYVHAGVYTRAETLEDDIAVHALGRAPATGAG